jgi:hypothetical protein
VSWQKRVVDPVIPETSKKSWPGPGSTAQAKAKGKHALARSCTSPAREWKLEGPKGKVPRCPGNATTYGQEPTTPGPGQSRPQSCGSTYSKQNDRKTTSNAQQSLTSRPRTKIASRSYSYDVLLHGVLCLPPCALCLVPAPFVDWPHRPRSWLPLWPSWLWLVWLVWLVFPGGVPSFFLHVRPRLLQDWYAAAWVWVVPSPLGSLDPPSLPTPQLLSQLRNKPRRTGTF